MKKITVEDNPELRSVFRKTFEWSFSAFMWVLWVYLLLPVITLILWAAGLHLIFSKLFGEAEMVQLMNIMKNLGLAVLIIFVTMRIWGYYNFYFFGSQDRRKNNHTVSPGAIGRQFGLSAAQVQKLQASKVVIWPVADDQNAKKSLSLASTGQSESGTEDEPEALAN